MPLPQVRRWSADSGELFEAAFNWAHFHVYDRLAALADLRVEDRPGFEHTNYPFVLQAGVDPRTDALYVIVETDRALELRARDRQRKLIAKIDAALSRIEDGSYGYCEETQEPIGIRRLEARPIATLSIEAQERHERRERVYRED